MTIKKVKKEVKKMLSPTRYKHSIMVANTAKKLAIHYQENKQDAYLAGLLHDIAKELEEEKLKYWIKKYHLPEELLKKENKNIIHADIGAVIAKEKYHVNDNIYNAIKYHTIGNKNMNTLAKIIYLSDKIGRVNIPPSLRPVKELAYQNINKALKYCLEQEEKYLKKKNINMHKDTKELLEKL